jgi:hypothetical protein
MYTYSIYRQLIAIGGIARIFARMVGSRYLAGLWQEGLLEQMCWKSRGSGARALSVHGGFIDCIASHELKIPYMYIAPSWSWACSTGPVTQSLSFGFDVHIYNITKILDMPVMITVNDNPYGQIKDGYVRLAGRLALARWHRGESETVLVSSTEEKHNVFDSSNIIPKFDLHSHGNSRISAPQKDARHPSMTYFLPLVGIDVFRNGGMTHSCGIILRSVRGLPSKFTRCGSFAQRLRGQDPKLSKACDYFDTISDRLGFESLPDDKGGKIYPVTII